MVDRTRKLRSMVGNLHDRSQSMLLLVFMEFGNLSLQRVGGHELGT